MTCPNCERYKESAKNWRHKAYELSGHPLPWDRGERLPTDVTTRPASRELKMKAFPGNRFEGMDLRDYFAAKAMQGLLSNPKLQAQILNTGGAWGSWVPESAYGWADAMMKAREIPNE